ncbi:hypothetical protein D3C87_1834490 [compost metagenome]
MVMADMAVKCRTTMPRTISTTASQLLRAVVDSFSALKAAAPNTTEPVTEATT